MKDQDTTDLKTTANSTQPTGPLTIQFPENKENGITIANGTKVTDSLGNEIAGVYGIALKAEAGGLWEATFKVHAHLAGSVSVQGNLSVPRIGEVWPNEGGIYAGIVRDGDRQWHLILAVDPASVITAPWGEYGETIKGEFSRHDGQQNTLLIFAAEPENKIVRHICQLQIDGHQDFYFPAQFENNLLCINLPEHLDKKWHWSSTQYSAYSAWIQDFEDGDQHFHYKYGSYAVRAVRRLPIE